MALALAEVREQHPDKDIQIDIYERANTLREVGAGIGVWPRAWRVMQHLGIDQELLEKTEGKVEHGPGRADVLFIYSWANANIFIVKTFKYRKSDQPKGFSIYDLSTTCKAYFFLQNTCAHLPTHQLAPCSHSTAPTSSLYSSRPSKAVASEHTQESRSVDTHKIHPPRLLQDTTDTHL